MDPSQQGPTRQQLTTTNCLLLILALPCLVSLLFFAGCGACAALTLGSLGGSGY